jgi:predicted nucleic acid-binding protein
VKYLLDTNVYFAVLRERDYFARHRDVLARLGPRTYLSSVVFFELSQGARGDLGRALVRRATATLQKVGRVVSPTDSDWERSGVVQGRIWDAHPFLRTKNLQNDLLLACTALRIGAIVVTENLTDFRLIARFLPHRTRSMAALASDVEA